MADSRMTDEQMDEIVDLIAGEGFSASLDILHARLFQAEVTLTKDEQKIVQAVFLNTIAEMALDTLADFCSDNDLEYDDFTQLGYSQS